MNKVLRFAVTTLAVLGATSAGAATHTVTVGNSFFSPAQLTIETGDTVVWVKTGSVPHNVVADDGSFRCARGCDGTGGNGSPTSAEWSFSLTFNDVGNNPYYCEVHGAPGGIGMSGSVTVEPASGGEQPGESVVVFVPIAGSVLGNNNTFFRTFLRVFNPSLTETISIAAAFLPVGQNNSAAPDVVFTVAPGQVEIFEDVVGGLLNANGLGAIRFHSDDSFYVTSRIFTDSKCSDPAGGTFGQFAPGTEISEALTSGVILHLNVSESFRSNVGFANTSDSPATITARLWDPSGMIGEVQVVLDPLGVTPPLGIAGLFGLTDLDQENLRVTFTSDQPVFGYGSNVDNFTSDQIYIPAQELP